MKPVRIAVDPALFALVDVNVYIDVLTKREGWKESLLSVLQAV